MPTEDTLGRLLVRDALPPDLRHLNGPLDKKGIQALYGALAEAHPDKYREVSKKLADLAGKAAYASGGYSFGPEHLAADPGTRQLLARFHQEVQQVLADPALSPRMRDAKLVQLGLAYSDPLTGQVMAAARAAGNPLALQVASGAKGKPENLKSLLAGDTLYADSNYEPVPIPVTRSFDQGLSPAQFFAGTFGARLAIVLTKLCLAGDTAVRMADGSVRPIRDVRPGDLVVGVSRAGVTSPTRVVALHHNGLRVCRHYVFREHASRTRTIDLVATPDHRVLANLTYGNSTTRGGQRLGTDGPTPLPLSRVSTVFKAQATTGGVWGGVAEPRAAILGLMLGDGYLGRPGRGSASACQFSCADPLLVEEMNAELAPLGLRLRKGSGYSHTVARAGVRGGENPLVAWLKELGLFGTRSLTKFIPPAVWGWDNESVAKLIGGLYATDGCVTGGRVSIASVSEPLIRGLRDLLAVRFGIHGGCLCRVAKENRDNAVSDLWVFDIHYQDSVRRFAAVVPVPGVKRQRLADTVAALGAPVRPKSPGYRSLVDRCVDVGMVDTYDLEVEHPDHLFLLANGLTVSNSTAEGGYFCLDAGTRVRLPNGRTRAIGRLRVGDEVVGVSRCGVPAVTAVTAVCRTGPKYAYEYRFAVPGRRRRVAVTATAEHRLLVALPAPDPAAPCPTAVVPLELAFLPDARGAAGPAHVAHAVALLPCGHDNQVAPVALRPADRYGVGEVDTVDIEVAHPDHLFLLANGLVVSNSKRIGNAAHRLVVTAPDRAHPPHPDEPARGLPTTVDDPDNEGALLAAPAGGHPRDTVLTREVIQDLKKNGVAAMLVRSPLVGGPADGGVYGHDVGVRERRTISPVGDHVGRAAADSLSEPITQLIIGCLAEGTSVRMADWSTKPIEAVAVGDWVLGADMAGRTFPVRVTRTYDNGVRTCLRTVFGFGRRDEELVFESTADHKVLASTRMTSCREEAENGVPRQLPVGKVAKQFYALPGSGHVDGGMVPEPRALLLGLLLGDGCYTEALNCDPHLSCADDVLVADLRPYLEKLNLKLTRLDAGGGLMYRLSQIEQVAATRDADTGRMSAGFRNPAKVLLDGYGMLGKYAHEKTIPNVAYTWDNESVGALLAGLFVTDGSIYQNKQVRLPFVAFGSTSRRLVEQFRELAAWRFGIYFAPVKANNSSRKRTLYSIELARFADVKAFRRYLPLVGVKRQRYDDLVAAGEAATAAVNRRARGRLDSPFRYKRKAQTEIGLRPTYDIEVDHPDHLFVLANGLITSNSKHSGGVAGATQGQQGFPVIDRLVSVPSAFPGAATHAQADGTVAAVRDAPQGGKYVVVDGREHHVPVGQAVTVAPGDKVEAGDPLSDGVENPREVVAHKHVGEGRRRFVDTFMRVAQASGFRPFRRNVELVARGLIDHVELTAPHGDRVPGDVVSYTALENAWQPRGGHRVVDPREAVGQYLERPALHFSIGTRVKPSMLPAFARHGVARVAVHPDPPPFVPVMVRSHETINHDPDWMTRMLGTHLQDNLLEGVHRGDVADPAGTSFVAPLAEGVNFGSPNYKSTGWTAPGG